MSKIGITKLAHSFSWRTQWFYSCMVRNNCSVIVAHVTLRDNKIEILDNTEDHLVCDQDRQLEYSQQNRDKP
jgi:hypothetical protein